MSQKPFNIKQGDTLPPLAVQLLGADKRPASLTGATLVFSMSGPGVVKNGVFVPDQTATLRVDNAEADVLVNEPPSDWTAEDKTPNAEYWWSTDDTDPDNLPVGLYRAEFEATWGPDEILTFPNTPGNDILVQVNPPVA